MENNEFYRDVCKFIEKYERSLTIVQNFKHQDYIETRRELEKNFERCIHALELRRDELLEKFDVLVHQREGLVNDAKIVLRESIFAHKAIKEEGESHYKTNKVEASRVWQKIFDLPQPNVPIDVMQTNLRSRLPLNMLNKIQDYGDVFAEIATEVLASEITFNETEDLIGKGQHSSIYKANWRGAAVAVKVFDQMHTPIYNNLKQQVNLLSLLSHPNVVRTLGICSRPLQIVTERCEDDIYSLLYDLSYNGSDYDRLKLARDIASGMEYMHQQTFVHGKLCPSKLLFDSNGTIKIADFASHLAKIDVTYLNTVSKANVRYMAPELLSQRVQAVSIATDVYSFGIILWEILSKELPYSQFTSLNQLTEAICHSNERPSLLSVPPNVRELIQACWHPVPSSRFSFDKIVELMNDILVRYVLTNPSAAKYWKDNFISKSKAFCENIEWNVLEQLLKTNDDKFLHNIKYMLVHAITEGETQSKWVSMKMFDQVEKWFGEFYSMENGVHVIGQINELFCQPWFHGIVSTEDCNSNLGGKPRGTFLIRLSFTDPSSPFILSLPQNRHTPITRAADGKLCVQGKQYTSLSHFVSANGSILRFPCTKNEVVRYQDFSFV